MAPPPSDPRATGSAPGPAARPDATTLRSRVASVLAGLTLDEKIGQMTQVELGSITPEEVARLGIGSVLSGGGGNPGDGTARAWREAVEAYVDASHRSRSGIPILYGTDAVHGHNNVLDATIFPHQIGLGATASPDLVRRVARAAALETAATGARWSFSPCLAVVGDIRWGRTYESFGSDSALVSALGRAAVEGWHGDDLDGPDGTGVLACAKHYVGEGAMRWGSAGSHRHPWIDWWDAWAPGWQIDQGDVDLDEDELRRTHLPPFAAAVEAGVLTVMAMYGSWRGRRVHGHRYLLTDLLKGELGFEGFVVSDWMAVDQLDADRATAVAAAIDAGVDMVMVPFDHVGFAETMRELVERDRVSIERIDDAVARIVTVKARLGLLDRVAGPEPDHSASRRDADEGPERTIDLDVIGCDAHRDLARLAVQASVVPLLDRGVLPVEPGTTVLAAGEALDDIGIACGGWTISWAGAPGPITTGRTVLDGLRRCLGEEGVTYDAAGRFGVGGSRAAVGVVSVHELPYVEGGGDRADLRLPDEQVEVVRRVRALVEHLVVVVVSGRPVLLGDVHDLADAVVACWLPGSEADGVADVLCGVVPCSGRLPMAWPHADIQIGPDGEATPWAVGHRDVPTLHRPLGAAPSAPLSAPPSAPPSVAAGRTSHATDATHDTTTGAPRW